MPKMNSKEKSNTRLVPRASRASKKIKPAETARTRETDLYAPIKRTLEAQGYEVKGEIGAADIVACRDAGDHVVVELKTGFSLTLFHQAIERQMLAENVYIAVPRGKGRPFLKALSANKKLCRLLGLGLMTVRLIDEFVEVHVDPAPYRPRKSKVKSGRLLREFERRVGDPNVGGTTRKRLMTAYRQDALRCAAHLRTSGSDKAARVAASTGVANARRIMADDHYGWFERISTGVYALTPNGTKATREYAREIKALRTAATNANT